MKPNEIQVQTNNFVEVSPASARVDMNTNFQKCFKYMIGLGVLLFILILVFSMTFMNNDETETLKQCLPGHYKFPDCIQCDCASDGSVDCDNNGNCICKHGFDGSKCDMCKEGFTGSKCDECKPSIKGHNCNQCKPTYFNYPLCQECICNPDGSTTLECGENNGVCSCKERFTGIKCHECSMPYLVGDKCDTCHVDNPFCQGMKVLITTGLPWSAMEIIDFDDSTFNCTKVESFPAGVTQLTAASGGLMNGQTPFICGGNAYINGDWKYTKDCFQLTEDGSWAKDQAATLSTPRVFAGYGSVVQNNKLFLTGGEGEGGLWLSSIEMFSLNATGKTLSVQLPFGMIHHCQVTWDSDKFMVIGGSNRNETFFINIKTDQLTKGPSLKVARWAHACGELEVNGKSYIIVTGGFNNVISTEFLEKDNVEQGWQKGDVFDLPVPKYAFQMISSPDKKTLYVIGGTDHSGNLRKEIYKSQCSGGISTCKWTQSNTELKNGRQIFVAFPIPKSLADKLCE